MLLLFMFVRKQVACYKVSLVQVPFFFSFFFNDEYIPWFFFASFLFLFWLGKGFHPYLLLEFIGSHLSSLCITFEKLTHD